MASQFADHSFMPYFSTFLRSNYDPQHCRNSKNFANQRDVEDYGLDIMKCYSRLRWDCSSINVNIALPKIREY